MSSAARLSRPYAGVRADERRLARRQRLIAAAIQVYGRVGYRNATVKAVCEAAKLTERYFYESFANSEALLIAAYLHVTDELHREMATAGAAAGSDAVARIDAVLTVYFTRLREHPRSARVFLLEMSGLGAEVDVVCMKALRDMSNVLVPPESRSKPMPLESVGMIGAVINIALRWVSQGYPDAIEDVVDAAARFCRLTRGGSDGRRG